MSSLEDLLLPGSTDQPDCRCGEPMHLSETRPRGDTEIRVFRCEHCAHELRLMVWGQPTD